MYPSTVHVLYCSTVLLQQYCAVRVLRYLRYNPALVLQPHHFMVPGLFSVNGNVTEYRTPTTRAGPESETTISYSGLRETFRQPPNPTVTLYRPLGHAL